MSRNFLDRETSPYLLQHKDNPVHWRAWNDESLRMAQAEDKIILLSVGYAACHWCHVMAHESFENEAIAALINRSFIPIKVDREERPDIDSFYQTALAVSGENGGWPLTLFLLPDGRPFAGGTYFPPIGRFGRPGFADILLYVAGLYPEKKGELEEQATALGKGLGRVLALPVAACSESLTPLVEKTLETALGRMDPENGGLRGAPKFPQPTFLGFLWHGALRAKQQQERHRAAAHAVLHTLKQMARGGIYDQIGGGFCRYATDSHWLVPHFEKMLYDNAQLLALLSSAWQKTGDAFFRRKAIETVAWMRRDMLTPEGMFAASLDADSDGQEGAFYVWDDVEIDAVLGENAASFKQAYGVTPQGNWEGKNILSEKNIPDEETAAYFEESRARLHQARAKRTAPQRDDKILADWNGMAIRALAGAAFAFQKNTWLDLAETVFSAVCSALKRPDNRLAHASCQGKQSGPAMLDDYAHLGLAALELYQRSGKTMYLHQAEVWADVVEEFYLDSESGAYFMTASDASDVPVRSCPRFDSVVPSGNTAMTSFLATLFLAGGKERYRQRFERLSKAMTAAATVEPLGLIGFLDAAQIMENPRQIVLVGEADSPSFAALHACLSTVPLVDTVVVLSSPSSDISADLPPEHPAFQKEMIDKTATVYICSDFICSSPLTERARVFSILSEN